MAIMESSSRRRDKINLNLFLIVVVMVSFANINVTAVIHLPEGIRIINVTMVTDTHQVILGERHNITVELTIHNEYDDLTGHVTSNHRWKVDMWMSQRPDGTGEKISYAKQMLSNSQKRKPLNSYHPFIFSDLVYELNLWSTPCRKIKYLCTSFGVRDDTLNVSQIISCKYTPVCKDGIVVDGLSFNYEPSYIITHTVGDAVNLSINVTVDYDRDVSGDVPLSLNPLWRIIVWMSDHHSGGGKRHSIKRNVIPSYLRGQGLVVGERFSFTDMQYSFNPDVLTNRQMDYICIKFRLIDTADYVILSRPNSIVRSACLPGPFYNVKIPGHDKIVGEGGVLPPIITMTIPLIFTEASAPSNSTEHGLEIDVVHTETALTPSIVPETDVQSITDGQTTEQLLLKSTDLGRFEDTALLSGRTPPPLSVSEPTYGVIVSHDVSSGSSETSSILENTPIRTKSHTPEYPEVTGNVSVTSLPVTPKDRLPVLVDRLGRTIVNEGEMTQQQVDDVLNIMQNISLFRHIPKKIAVDVIHHISDFIDTATLAPLSNISHISERLNQILDNIYLDGGNKFHVVSKNMRVSSFRINTSQDAKSSSRDFFSFGQVYPKGSSTSQMGHNPIDIQSQKILQDGVEAGFFVPRKALPLLEDDTGKTDIRVNFIVFSNDRLFDAGPLTNLSMERPFNTSRVTSLDVTVGGQRVTSLSNVVSLAFQVPKATSQGSRICVWWDFVLNSGQGGWSKEGCNVSMATDEHVICHCNHLTNFAVLMMPVDESHPEILDRITEIGCALSILSLGLTLLTYLTFKKLMPTTAQLILIQWVLALLCLYTTFLFGIDYVTHTITCQVVAALLHFFTLAYICWTSVEALQMYFVIVQTMNGLPRARKFIPWSTAYAWGGPLVIVAVSLLISGEDRQVYELQKYCFLQQGLTFYYVLLIPIGAILLFNIVCFMLIMYRINYTRPKVTMMRRDRKKLDFATVKAKQAMTIAILVGVTWIIGFFATVSRSFVFVLAFCICNSFTGVIVFLLFCLLRKEVRHKWKEMLHCGCCFVKQDQFRRRGFSDTSSVARQSCTVRTHSISLEFMPKTMIVDLSSPTISDCLESPLTDKSDLF